MKKDCAVILAAGEGARMKSAKPLVLAEVLFKPMIDWVIDGVRASGIEDICVVVGHLSDEMRKHLGDSVETVYQSELLGTGHAVMQAKDFITRHGSANVLILNGDAPFIDAETIKGALNFHVRTVNQATVISSKIDNPQGYGRIVRSSSGQLMRIVEEKDASENEKQINEVNSGAYWFNCQALLNALGRLSTFRELSAGSRKKEYQLTDAVEIILSQSLNATAFNSRVPDVVLGANDRIQLAKLNEIARASQLSRQMLEGVSIPCADGVIIGPDVDIGADTLILPGCVIKGKTVIGSNCVIGPNTWIEDSRIEDGAQLNNTQCFESRVGEGAQVGPFARIRPGTLIGKEVRLGNFVEIKNAVIGDETKISHLSYIGDADVGRDVNIGSGCATVNYNGREKSRTVISDGAFIGCDTSMIAPVSIGRDAYIAAGSTVTDDVPANALAIARAKQVNKKDWVSKKKPYKRQPLPEEGQ